MKYRILVLAIILIIVAVSVSTFYQNALKKREMQIRETALTPADYEPLLKSYNENIDALVKMRDEKASFQYRQAIERFNEQDQKLLKNETRILDNLRKEARLAHGLGYDGNCSAKVLLVPTSEAAARITHTLYKEGFINLYSSAIPDRDHDFAQVLSPGWITLAEELADSPPRDSKYWKQAGYKEWQKIILTLYKAGDRRDKYRPLLEQWAREGNSQALLDLLFNADAKTGGYTPVRTPENTALIKSLLDDNPDPLIKANCAYYAARTDNLEQAEKLCNEVLAMTYAPSHGKFEETNKQRQTLHSARTGLRGEGALDTLFFKVRTESAFKQVFQRAFYIDMLDRETVSDVPKEWLDSNNSHAEWDLMHASSLLFELRTFDLHSNQAYINDTSDCAGVTHY